MRNKGVVPISKQSMIIAGLVAVAFGALILGSIYQGERDIGSPVIVGDLSDTEDTVPESDESPGGRVVGSDGKLSEPTNDNSGVNPIESFLPASPTGANCREAVGVDLIDGYAASLVINGTRIPTEDMNGADPDTGAIPAGRTQGRYTFGPEEGCPNGNLLRPRDNTLQACVYKIEEGPDTCVVSEFTFNAL